MTEYYSLKVELLQVELEERKQRQNQGFVPVFIHAQDSNFNDSVKTLLIRTLVSRQNNIPANYTENPYRAIFLLAH